MSSIAYVTDRQMIEFHRLNGNAGINFWRPSIGKRFTDFHSGDLLFFLAKGTELKHSKEKGIIGYGRFTESEQLSFRQMWGRYSTLNGYATELGLKDAILRVAKSKNLPPRLSCLHLKDVVFFQAPVYLSELGLKISNNIESFTYLDKDDPEVTTRILLKANEIGVDAWTSAVSPTNPTATVFDDDLARHLIQLKRHRIPSLGSEREQAKSSKYLAHYLKEHPDFQWLDSSHQELFKFKSEGIEIVSCEVCLKQDMWARWVHQVGKQEILKSEAKTIPGFEGKKLDFYLLCEPVMLDTWNDASQPYPLNLMTV